MTYHQRQLTFCVNVPPINGPETEATAKVPKSELIIAGLSRGLEHSEMITKHPTKVSAQPALVTARPAMKALLFGANAFGSQHYVCLADYYIVAYRKSNY